MHQKENSKTKFLSLSSRTWQKQTDFKKCLSSLFCDGKLYVTHFNLQFFLSFNAIRILVWEGQPASCYEDFHYHRLKAFQAIAFSLVWLQKKIVTISEKESDGIYVLTWFFFNKESTVLDSG